MIGSFGLAFVAGILSVLSPCVLPLLPIVLGSAASQHKWGPVALAIGVALSFVAIGLFVATVGFAIGFDTDAFRIIAAVLMIMLGAVLAIPPLQMRVAAAGGPISNWAEQSFGGFSPTGLTGQFAIGLLLGAVWSPCVGPTLGAASLLAAKGENLGTVAFTMIVFGLGAGIPLIVLGSMSRQLLLRWRNSMSTASAAVKQSLGMLLIVIGLLIVTGLDKSVETRLVETSPQWLTNITTHF